MSKQLLVEYTTFEVTPQQINESLSKNGGKLIVSGVLQRAEAKNQNGRIYPKETLMREADKYAEGFIAEKRALGELDHPDNNVISLEKVSHRVTAIWMEGNVAMGKVQVLNTPSGKILQELVNGGCKMGISSRGMGSVREDKGMTIVEDDFQLICFDFVSEPSTPGAFMMKESKQFQKKLYTKADRINRLLNEVLEE